MNEISKHLKKLWPLFSCVAVLSGSANTANAGTHAEAERTLNIPAAPAAKCAAPVEDACTAEKRKNPACAIRYPAFARKNNVEGVVEVEFTVDEEGNYSDIHVVSRKLTKTSVTDKEGNVIDVTKIFDSEVVRALSACRCSSACAKVAKPTRVRVPFSFRLTG
jgi:outer membrane biosynthesis protein TonB